MSEKITNKVAEIYNRLDSHIRKQNLHCRACGKCCDFDSFGHRLFVTTAELIYLTENLPPEEIKPMTTSRCPYNEEGKCTIRDFRFAACRIFFCSADPNLQSRLTEDVLRKLKSLCITEAIPWGTPNAKEGVWGPLYRYTDLKTALNSLTAL